MISDAELYEKMGIDDFARMKCHAFEFAHKCFLTENSGSISPREFIDAFEHFLKVCEIAHKIQKELGNSVPEIRKDQFFEFLEEKIENSIDFSDFDAKKLNEFTDRVFNFCLEYR